MDKFDNNHIEELLQIYRQLLFQKQGVRHILMINTIFLP